MNGIYVLCLVAAVGFYYLVKAKRDENKLVAERNSVLNTQAETAERLLLLGLNQQANREEPSAAFNVALALYVNSTVIAPATPADAFRLAEEFQKFHRELLATKLEEAGVDVNAVSSSLPLFAATTPESAPLQ